MSKKIYCVMLDGVIYPETHLFIMREVTTAIYAFITMVMSVRNRDVSLFCIGECKDNGVISSIAPQYVCNYRDALSVFLRNVKTGLNNDVKSPSFDSFRALYYDSEYMFNNIDYISERMKNIDYENSDSSFSVRGSDFGGTDLHYDLKNSNSSLEVK